MLYCHSWPRKAHNLLDLLTLHFFVAMNRTPGTAGFFCAIRTFLKAFYLILQQRLALLTDGPLIRSVVMRAKDFRHAHESRMLSFQPAGEMVHGVSLAIRANGDMTRIKQARDVPAPKVSSEHAIRIRQGGKLVVDNNPGGRCFSMKTEIFRSALVKHAD